MKLKNRTSNVPVDRIVARIEYALVNAGASNIVKDYEDGLLRGIMFTVRDRGKMIAVKLPAKVDAVKKECCAICYTAYGVDKLRMKENVK